MISLKGQVIVITGGSEGLGKAIALKLGGEGAKIVLLARDQKKLEKVCKEIGKTAEYYVCDIRDQSQVHSTFENIYKEHQRVDILINNAGVWYEGPIEEHSTEAIDNLFDTNVKGTIYTIQEVVGNMKQRKSGQILNVISTSGVEIDPGWPVYIATKYAVRGLTDSLKAALAGTGIKVMGFYPGGMNTEIFNVSGFSKDDTSWMMKKEHVAEVVDFVLKQPDDIWFDNFIVQKPY